MALQSLAGFGEEITNLGFKDNLDWFISFRDPREAFKAQPTYIASEYLFYTLGLITLIHSFIVGGRWKYHWLAIYLHGLTTEMVAFWMPEIDNYWHSQTSVMLLGRRLPLHITFLYPIFMYNAAYMVAHLKLPRCVEPLAAGLTEVLMDIPYDIMAVKFVHWTWHDTDPNIFDRHYNVPWTSYYFHLTFGAAFTFALHFWRRRITGTDDKGQVSSFGKEVTCAVLAGLCGMPGGVVQFMALYHPLHDMFNIHTENCVILIIAAFLFLVWAADRQPSMGSRMQKGDKTHWSSCFLMFGLFLHYGFWLLMAIAGNPEQEVSIGLHQRTGRCDKYSDVQTAFGMVLKKQTFLCTKDYDEQYFDFKCLKSPPKNNVEWYTICGNKFHNRAEYISMISGICFVAFIVYYNMLRKSAPTLVYNKKKELQKAKKELVKSSNQKPLKKESKKQK